MTTTVFYWKIYCNTDAKFEYIWAEIMPELCPIDNGHTVDISQTGYKQYKDVYTVTDADSPVPLSYDTKCLICDTSSGNIQINLKPASRILTDLHIILIKSSDSNTLTIDGFESELIDGTLTKVFSTSGSYIITSDGTSSWTSGDSSNDQTLNCPTYSQLLVESEPLVTDATTLSAGDTYILEHFGDPENKRIIIVTEENSETYDDNTYNLNSTLSDKYTITNPSIGELNSVAFSLSGTGYIEGSNLSTTATASASTEQTPASSGNDNDTNSYWYNTSGNVAGAWWSLDFGSTKAFYSAEVEWYTTSYYCTSITLDYSIDGSSWSNILTDNSVTYTSSGSSAGTYKFADFSSVVFARHIRFTFNNAVNTSYVVMREGRVFEAINSGFSTVSNSTINNIKENRQIYTELWDQINSSTINGTFPSGTSTNILLSFDNQVTWVYWNGGSWQTSTLGNIATTAMTHTTFNSLSSANYAASNGLNSDTLTLDIAINISSTDSSKTPIITDITFNVTTNVYQENISDGTIRIRHISATKTEIKNLSNTSKLLNISINNNDS